MTRCCGIMGLWLDWSAGILSQGDAGAFRFEMPGGNGPPDCHDQSGRRLRAKPNAAKAEPNSQTAAGRGTGCGVSRKARC